MGCLDSLLKFSILVWRISEKLQSVFTSRLLQKLVGFIPSWLVQDFPKTIFKPLYLRRKSFLKDHHKFLFQGDELRDLPKLSNHCWLSFVENDQIVKSERNFVVPKWYQICHY